MSAVFLIFFLSLDAQKICGCIDKAELRKILGTSNMTFANATLEDKGKEQLCTILLSESDQSINLSIKKNDKFDMFSSLFPQYISKLIKDGELVSKLKPQGLKRKYDKIDNTIINACYHGSENISKLVWVSSGEYLYMLSSDNLKISDSVTYSLFLELAIIVH